MKSLAFLFAAASLAAGPVLAQSSPPAGAPARLSAPPPPGIDDPGVKASAPARAASAAPSGSSPAEMPATSLPGKPIPLPQEPGGAGASGRQPPPQVTVRKEGDQTIEEYRQGGRVYMVVVTPKNGVPQTYMVDQSGHVSGPDGTRKVSPVMYKVLEWGKSAPARDNGQSSSGD